MRILIIEDDALLGDAIRRFVTARGYAADIAQDVDHAETALKAADFSVILLDLNLPDGHGLAFLQNIRRRGVATPVIIITAMDGIADRINGLDAGADDYLIKPFDLDELLARVRAAVRRAENVPSSVFVRGPVSIDLAKRIALSDGEGVSLTAREWAVLDILITNAGAIVSRSELEARLYDFSAETESNSVEVFVSRIRKKLHKDLIKTERGLGYRIEAPK